MAALIEIGLLNAPVALCLAGIVLVIGRFWKQPALLHALWVLVLLKLLMPPLVQVPLPWELPDWIDTSTQANVGTRAELERYAGDGSGLPSHATSQVNLPGPGTASSGASAGALDHSTFLPGPTSNEDQSFWQPILLTSVRFARSLFATVLCLWAIGSAIWFFKEGWRIVRFAQVFLRHARLAPKPMQRQASNLAREMGIRRCPEVWLLSAVVSPMLWSVGGRARILFPSQLAMRLDKGALATLLTHELAHYYRGDHWVRMLEFVVSGLFWWHPAVWIARREIEIHEEQCCDAWVVSQFPKSPRQYADALLATIDFLSEERTVVLPASASGLGDVPLIRQRLILIMRGAAPKSLGTVGRITVVMMALLIPVQPRLLTKPAQQAVLNIEQPIGVQPSNGLPKLPEEKQRVSPRGSKDFDGAKSKSVPDSRLSKQSFQPSATTTVISRSTLSGKPNRSFDRKASVGNASASNASIGSPMGKTGWLVWAMATAPNMLSRIIAHDDGQILWQHFCSEEDADLSCFDIITVAYTPEGQLFVAGCRDGAIRVWDSTNGQLLQTLIGHKSDVRAVAISPQGDWLASGDQQGQVRLWSVLGNSSSELLANYCAPIGSLAFSSDGKTVAVATGARFEGNSESEVKNATRLSADTDRGLVALWNVLDRTEFTQIETESPLAVIAFSNDSSRLSGAEWTGRVLTWNIGSRKLLATSFIDRKLVAAAAFASDGGPIRPQVGQMF